MLDQHAVYVDLETTAAIATHDRITEIGIVEVNRRFKRCRGACAGLETRAQHALRLKQALMSLRMLPWSFAAPAAIREHAADGETSEWHVLDR